MGNSSAGWAGYTGDRLSTSVPLTSGVLELELEFESLWTTPNTCVDGAITNPRRLSAHILLQLSHANPIRSHQLDQEKFSAKFNDC